LRRVYCPPREAGMLNFAGDAELLQHCYSSSLPYQVAIRFGRAAAGNATLYLPISRVLTSLAEAFVMEKSFKYKFSFKSKSANEATQPYNGRGSDNTSRFKQKFFTLLYPCSG
jgi:hypothetical protein